MIFNSKKQKGFTLIEMSVVLVIIGVLMGIFMKSKVMIRDAKIKSVLIETQKIKRGANSFRSKYGGWPGDYREAVQNVNQCTVGNNCKAGDGNGVIDTADERDNFWKHLYLNNFIANERTNGRVLNNSLWEVYYSVAPAQPPHIRPFGHWLVVYGNGTGNCCFSLQEQKRVDMLNDDGDPDAGLISYSTHGSALPNISSGPEIKDGGLAFKLDK